jgi:hypothetical protein
MLYLPLAQQTLKGPPLFVNGEYLQYTPKILAVSPIFNLRLTLRPIQPFSYSCPIALAESFPNPCRPIHLAVGENIVHIRGLQSGPLLDFGTKISAHVGRSSRTVS